MTPQQSTRRRKMARDSQRAALYAWERKLPGWPGQPLTLGQCQALICEVWGDYLESDAPLATDGRGRRRACYEPASHRIKLPRWSRARFIVLHEVAHGLIWSSVPEAAAHGAEFARVYLNLLHRYERVPLARARALANHQQPRRVHFALIADVPSLRPESQRRPARVAGQRRGRLLF